VHNIFFLNGDDVGVDQNVVEQKEVSHLSGFSTDFEQTTFLDKNSRWLYDLDRKELNYSYDFLSTLSLTYPNF